MRQIQIKLPEDAKDIVVQYEKVAQIEDASKLNIKELLEEKITYNEKVVAGENDEVILNALEYGVYQIEISGDERYEFSPFLVSIPSWDEEMKTMVNEVKVIPKYIRNILPPNTADKSISAVYIGFAVISFIIVVFMSCHKRLKCGRMSHKNSKKRRT